MDLEMHAYERPLAVTPGGIPEVVPKWQDTHAMRADTCVSQLGKWIRTDLGARTFQGLGKNSPAREQVVRRITRDLRTQHILEDLVCDSLSQVPLHRRCLPECSPSTSHTRDIVTTFVYRLLPRLTTSTPSLLDCPPSQFPSGGCTKHDSFKRPAAQATQAHMYIAFGGSVRIARVSACPRKGEASVAVSATCLSTSVPHSSGTCLETGIYTTVSCGSRAHLAERKD